MGNGNKIGEEKEQDVLDFNASEKIKQKIENVDEDYKSMNSEEFREGVVEGLRVAFWIIREDEMKQEDLKEGEEKSKENHPSQNCDNSMWSITKRKGYEKDEKKTIEENRKAERVYYGESHPCDVDEEDM